jgi:outer membrane protein assembly factor BamB
MSIVRYRVKLRPWLSGLAILAVVALAGAVFLAAPSTPSHAAMADQTPRSTWVSDRPLSGTTALARAGGTLYVGGDFPNLGQAARLALLDAATGQPLYGLPEIDGTVSAVVPDGAGGWFLGGRFTVVSQPAFADLVHIRADKTLDTAWNPRLALNITGMARSSTALYLKINPEPVLSRTTVAAVAISDAQLLPWKPAEADVNLLSGLLSTDDTVYVLQNDNADGDLVIALDARTGQARWRVRLPGTARALALQGTTLYIGGDTATGVSAVDTAGRRLLPFKIDIGPNEASHGYVYNPSVDKLTLVGNTLAIGGMFRSLNGQTAANGGALDLRTGKLLWAISSLAIGSQGNLIYHYSVPSPYSQFGTLTAMDATSGLKVWERALTCSQIDALGASAAGVLLSGQDFVGQASGSNLVALDLASGTPAGWRPQPNGPVAQLTTSATTLYVAGGFSQIAGQARPGLAAFDLATGALSGWSPQPDGPIRTLLVGGGRLYVAGGFSQIAGQARPGLAAFDLATGALSGWTPSGLPAGRIGALALGSDALYVAADGPSEPGVSHPAAVMAIDLASGAPTGWGATLTVASLHNLAVFGSSLYVRAAVQDPKVPEPSQINRLVVFDTRSSAPPTTLQEGGAAGWGLVFHDQTLYLSNDLRLDLPTHTVFSWGRSCGSEVAEAGPDLLAIDCDGRLHIYPYVATPLVESERRYVSDSTSATLEGHINPNGSPTSAFFQLTSQPGNCDALRTMPVSGVLTGTRTIDISVLADGLATSTTYTYRLVAINASGVSYSTIYRFTSSAGGPPGVKADTHAPAAAPAPTPAEVTATPAWRVFLPALRRCPTDGL